MGSDSGQAGGDKGGGEKEEGGGEKAGEAGEAGAALFINYEFGQESSDPGEAKGCSINTVMIN